MAKKAKTNSTKRATSSGPSGAKGKVSPAAKKASKSVKTAPSPKAAVGKSTPSKAASKTVASVTSKTPEKKSAKSASKNAGQDTGKNLESAAGGSKTPAPKAVEAAPKKSEKTKSRGASEKTVTTPSVETRQEVEAPSRAAALKSGKLAKSIEPEPVQENEESASDSEKSPEKKKKRDELKIDRAGDLVAQWQALYDRTKAVKPVSYKMSENYEARTPLLHKVLGWGYVLVSQNNRLEVLFKDGIKILIANYKGG